MTRQGRLTLDDPSRPVPTRPTLLHALGGQAHAERYDTVRELAQAALRIAGDAAGLRLAAQAATTAYEGFELFEAFSLYALDGEGGEAWLASCAVQDTPRDVLEAAIGAAVAERERRAAA